MKTIDKLRIVLPVVLFSTILLSATDANAQNRWKKEKNQHERGEFRERDDHGDRNYYDNSRENRDYAYQDDYRHDDARNYSSGRNNRYKHEARYFNHPQYGRVYQRFDYNPIVLHRDRDNYYYYGNNFYTYRRGIGYCVVEPPRNVYFRTLPDECERVYVNGNILFRHGDLFFQLSPRGYSIVTAPIQVRISARF